MKAISSFAGIGGFDLAFERAGMTITDQIEWDPACQVILRRHFTHATLLRRHLWSYRRSTGTT